MRHVSHLLQLGETSVSAGIGETCLTFFQFLVQTLLCADATLVCLYTAWKIAHPLLPQIKSEIDSLVRQEIISPVTVPTRWCSGMVPVQKANGTVRICVDPTHLNKSVLREIHPMSSVDESLAKFGNIKVFSKLDTTSGFWQLPLDDESRLLTTFIMSHGRSCFNRYQFLSGDIPANNVPNSGRS